MNVDPARSKPRSRHRVLARIAALRRKLARTEGQALLEMALVSPAVLLLSLGICIFGLMLNQYLVLSNAATIGAQQMAISRYEVTDPCASVYTAVTNAAPNLTAGNLGFTIAVNGTNYVSGLSGSKNVTCTSELSTYNNAQNQYVTVTVTYPFSAGFIGFTNHSYTMQAAVGGVIQ